MFSHYKCLCLRLLFQKSSYHYVFFRSTVQPFLGKFNTSTWLHFKLQWVVAASYECIFWENLTIIDFSKCQANLFPTKLCKFNSRLHMKLDDGLNKSFRLFSIFYFYNTNEIAEINLKSNRITIPECMNYLPTYEIIHKWYKYFLLISSYIKSTSFSQELVRNHKTL